MTFLEKLSLLERLDQLIRMKATGSAEQLARRLNISRSKVYELIQCLQSMDADVSYCKRRQSFYYETDKVLAIGFVERTKINGGMHLFENNFIQSGNFGQTACNIDSEIDFQGILRTL